MFGNFVASKENRKIDQIRFETDGDSRYRSANDKNSVIVDTPLGRVYINETSYFTNVPQSAWSASFAGEQSPEQLLSNMMGENLDDKTIHEIQVLLADLVDAEFKAKNIETV